MNVHELASILEDELRAKGYHIDVVGREEDGLKPAIIVHWNARGLRMGIVVREEDKAPAISTLIRNWMDEVEEHDLVSDDAGASVTTVRKLTHHTI